MKGKVDKCLPIGVFDSGVGGISVLAELSKQLPQEHFIYFGDSLNAPYGVRPPIEIRQLTFKAVKFLTDKGIKALVVACNTATSAAIHLLRQELSIPVIGMEPALKPAVSLGRQGKIVVMATPLTLKEKKFSNLLNRFKDEADVITLPCPGLVELVERGMIQDEAITQYLTELFAALNFREVAAVVLGCTHYVFVKGQIKQMIGKDTCVLDGNCGTVKHLKQVLEQNDLRLLPLSEKRDTEEQIKLFTSGNEIEKLPLFKQLLEMGLKQSAN